jgi:SAM-dependent methyltransferase
MKKEYEDQYHRLESDHWWFCGRRQIAREIVLQSNPDHDCRILEVGCSGGRLMTELRHHGYRKVTGIDISTGAIAVCKRNGLVDVHLMDGQKPNFAEMTFDLIVASDVLEHMREDSVAVQSWCRLLRPNGRVIVFVPAFGVLWSQNDVENEHYRRYRRSRLCRLLAENGFVVERSSYWNAVLFFPILFARTLKRLLARHRQDHHGDLHDTPPLVNWALAKLLALENLLISRGVNFPVGVSVMAVARKLSEGGPSIGDISTAS